VEEDPRDDGIVGTAGMVGRLIACLCVYHIDRRKHALLARKGHSVLEENWKRRKGYGQKYFF
jgi:hypothetical protein